MLFAILDTMMLSGPGVCIMNFFKVADFCGAWSFGILTNIGYIMPNNFIQNTTTPILFQRFFFEQTSKYEDHVSWVFAVKLSKEHIQRDHSNMQKHENLLSSARNLLRMLP